MILRKTPLKVYSNLNYNIIVFRAAWVWGKGSVYKAILGSISSRWKSRPARIRTITADFVKTTLIVLSPQGNLNLYQKALSR